MKECCSLFTVLKCFGFFKYLNVHANSSHPVYFVFRLVKEKCSPRSDSKRTARKFVLQNKYVICAPCVVLYGGLCEHMVEKKAGGGRVALGGVLREQIISYHVPAVFA